MGIKSRFRANREVSNRRDISNLIDKIKLTLDHAPDVSPLAVEANSGRNVFLDNGSILPGGPHDLFETYLFLTDYHSMLQSNTIVEKMIETVEDLAEKQLKNLQSKNILVLRPIYEEAAIYLEMLKRRCLGTGRFERRLLTPIELIVAGAERSTARVAEMGIEEDPLIPRIKEKLYGFIPFVSDPLSPADKHLIAVPMAMGIYDGGVKVIITKDNGIHEAIGHIYQEARAESRRIPVGDLGDNLNGSQIEVKGLVPRGKYSYLKTKISIHTSFLIDKTSSFPEHPTSN